MKTGGRQVFGEINITPLTDIFLVLLIIMMVVAPLINYKGLNVHLAPDGAPTESSDESKAMLVAIAADGTFTVDGETVVSAQLPDIFKAKSPENPDGVSIEINPEAPMEYMTMALDAARLAGIEKVAIGSEDDGKAGI